MAACGVEGVSGIWGIVLVAIMLMSSNGLISSEKKYHFGFLYLYCYLLGGFTGNNSTALELISMLTCQSTEQSPRIN